MSLHLRLELSTAQELEDWERVKQFLGSKSNTEALRVLIRRTALDVRKLKDHQVEHSETEATA